MPICRADDLHVLREAIEKIEIGLAAWEEDTWVFRTGNALGRRLAALVDRTALEETRARLRDEETVTLAVTAGDARFRARVRRARWTEYGPLLVAWFYPVGDDGAAWSTRIGLKYRERQILALVLSGLRNREIAGRLGIAEGTVKQYLNRIFGAFEVRSRAELILRATQQP